MARDQDTKDLGQEEIQDSEGQSQDNQPEIDYKAELKKAQEELEKKKSEIAGLDRKVGEVSRTLDEFRKAKETEAEAKAREAKEKAEAEELRVKGLAQKETDLLNQENALNIKLKAVELNVPLSDVEELKLGTPEQVEAYAKKMKGLLEQGGQQAAKDIENKLSGKREELNNNEKNRADNSFIDGCNPW